MENAGIIFDLDGTLADTLQDIAFFMNSILRKRGFPEHPVDSYRYKIGGGMRNLVLHALPEDKLLDSMIAECEEELVESYYGNPVVKTVLYPGIPLLLDRLQEEGVVFSILSNKSHSLVVEVVDILLSSWNFREIWGQKSEYPKKPDPETAIVIAESMKIKPENMLFIGDSAVDIHTAANASMQSVGVLWGFRDRDELEEAGARYLVERPEQILDILRNGGR